MTKPKLTEIESAPLSLTLGLDVEKVGELDIFNEALAAYQGAVARREEWYADRDLSFACNDDRIEPDDRDLHKLLTDWEAAGYRLAQIEPVSLGQLVDLLEEAAKISAHKAIAPEMMGAKEFALIACAARGARAIYERLSEAEMAGREPAQ